MYAAYAVVQRVPLSSWLVGSVLLILAFGLLLLPWWAPKASERVPESRLRLAGVITFAVWLALSVLGAFLDRG
ncbi:MAG: hypothetical protein ABL977_13700, partial [Candidatus Eisenbacteria bacterium]